MLLEIQTFLRHWLVLDFERVSVVLAYPVERDGRMKPTGPFFIARFGSRFHVEPFEVQIIVSMTSIPICSRGGVSRVTRSLADWPS